jgi:riboflavin kinase/FMN adenylyltransferase
VVITFSSHPREALNANYVPKLITLNDERYQLLEKSGVDYLVVLPFNEDIARRSFKQFMDDFLIAKFNVKYLLVGHDHHFGCDRINGFAQYKQYGEEKGVEVEREEPFKIKDDVISSSFIRRNILAGDVEKAAEALGYDYFLEGTVMPGYKMGRTIGYPTANLAISDVRKLLPSAGVYIATVNIEGDEKVYTSMLYIGSRPTFVNMSESKSIEVHMFDFNEDIYHKKIRINLKKFFREELHFDNPSKLATQLNKDKQAIKDWFAKKK